MEAKCVKCGARYYGWSLAELKNQTCTVCGGKLKIVKPRKPKNGALNRKSDQYHSQRTRPPKF